MYNPKIVYIFLSNFKELFIVPRYLLIKLLFLKDTRFLDAQSLTLFRKCVNFRRQIVIKVLVVTEQNLHSQKFKEIDEVKVSNF